MKKDRNGTKHGTLRRTGMLLLLLMVFSLLMSGCITINGTQDAPQPEQITDAPENSGSGTEISSDGGDVRPGEADPEVILSEDEVIKIVLDRVPGAAADEVTALRLGTDDGMREYEGKLIHNGLEYEFEIDAVNGNILEWEIDD